MGAAIRVSVQEPDIKALPFGDKVFIYIRIHNTY